MYYDDQLQILKGGVDRWNSWRNEHAGTKIMIVRGDLSGAQLKGANLSGATFLATDLSGACLLGADLSGARISNTLKDADLRCVNLCGASLDGVDLSFADLSYADLTGAEITDSNLEFTRLINTNFTDATLQGCRVFGVSAWGLTLDGANQENLRITPYGQSTITVDDLEVAQFIYLMLSNQNVRRVIQTITTKLVLILGRFTEKRKPILDALRDELRSQDYLPIIFDFDRPAGRDLTETVSTLAHMARFIIADITDATSIPQELHAIIPHLPSVPVQPLLLSGKEEYGMFEHFKRYEWVLATHIYKNSEELIAELQMKVIGPAEAKATELRR